MTEVQQTTCVPSYFDCITHSLSRAPFGAGIQDRSTYSHRNFSEKQFSRFRKYRCHIGGDHKSLAKCFLRRPVAQKPDFRVVSLHEGNFNVSRKSVARISNQEIKARFLFCNI